MTCIRTGADVYFPDWGCTMHGDLYEVGGTYIFVHTGIKTYHDDLTAIHLTMNQWEECGARVIAAESWNCGEFSYLGVRA